MWKRGPPGRESEGNATRRERKRWVSQLCHSGPCRFRGPSGPFRGTACMSSIPAHCRNMTVHYTTPFGRSPPCPHSSQNNSLCACDTQLYTLSRRLTSRQRTVCPTMLSVTRLFWKQRFREGKKRENDGSVYESWGECWVSLSSSCVWTGIVYTFKREWKRLVIVKMLARENAKSTNKTVTNSFSVSFT